MFGKKKMRISRRARKNAAMEVVPAEPKAMTLDELIDDESAFDVLAAADAEYNGFAYNPSFQNAVEDELVELEPIDDSAKSVAEAPVVDEAADIIETKQEEQVDPTPEQKVVEVAEEAKEESAEAELAEEAAEEPAQDVVQEQDGESEPQAEASEEKAEEVAQAEENAEDVPAQDDEQAEEQVEDETAEESDESDVPAEDADACESAEEADDSPYEAVDGADDELTLPHLVNLPNLIEYMTSHNSSKHMKLSVGLMLASGYNKVKDNPDEKKLMLKSMAITLKSLMNS